jgi:hypothetical protein
LTAAQIEHNKRIEFLNVFNTPKEASATTPIQEQPQEVGEDLYTQNLGFDLQDTSTPLFKTRLDLPEAQPQEFKDGGKKDKPENYKILPETFNYEGRPGARYRRDNFGNWLVADKNTNGEFVAVKDASGERQAELNRRAVSADTGKTVNEYAKKEVKDPQKKFEQEAWNDYDKLSTSEKVLDRVKAAMVDPIGMTARLITGDQAYIPGMGNGLLNTESENYDKYLKSVGYTQGKFEASDLQNILNPMYWGASAGNQLDKGNTAQGLLETGLAFAGAGQGKNMLQGVKYLADDVAKGSSAIGQVLGTETGLLSKVDRTIYPTRTYRAHLPGGNETTYEASELAKKINEKGDWSTKDLSEVQQYLAGTEAFGSKRGLLTGDDMLLTEYKIPFWKKNVSYDKDVTALKKLQNVDINPNEFIVPNNRFLYPRRTNLLKAVPEELKSFEEILPSGMKTNLYSANSVPLGYTSTNFASKPYRYIEDQINAVTGHDMPLTYEFNQELGWNQNIPMHDWTQKQFAPNKGLGNFNRFDPMPKSIQKFTGGKASISEAKNTFTPNSLINHLDNKFILQDAPVTASGITPKIKNLPTIETHGFGVTSEEVQQVIDQNIEYLKNPEYLKRRIATTGEKPNIVEADIEKYIRRLKNSTINLNDKGIGVQGLATHGKELFKVPLIKSKVSVNSSSDLIKSKEDVLHILDHEVKHILSPATETNFALRKYKNYPHTAIEKGVKHEKYIADDAEQQVRYLRIKDYLDNKYGISKNSPISEQDWEFFRSDLSKWSNEQHAGLPKGQMPTGLKDIEQLLLKRDSKVTSEELRKNINKAWGLVPIAGAVGSEVLSQQQYREGGTQDLSTLLDTDKLEEFRNRYNSKQ